MKLHLGCGTVYLEGYVNIDVRVPGYSFLATERPDLVEKNRTTLSHYYKTPQSKETLHDKTLPDSYCVVDQYGSMLELDFQDNSVDEILTVQSFEHLSRQEAQQALRLWHRLLKPAGIVHIDVPDFEETARQLLAQKTEEKKEWYYRLIFGSQKNPNAFHKDSFSYAKLKRMVEGVGFRRCRSLPNTLHFYPAVILEAEK